MVKKNILLLSIIIFSTILMLCGIGERSYSGDESHTAMVAKTIVKHGIPKVVDGDIIYSSGKKFEQSFNDEDLIRLGEINLAIYPPLHFYIVSLGFKMFGFTNFAGRILPAILGVLTIFLLYLTALKINNDKQKSLLITFLLSTCIPFYLYSRQARYYSLVSFVSLAVLYSYLMFKNKERFGDIFLILSSIVLFYSYYIPFAIMMISIGFHTLWSKDMKQIIRIIKIGATVSIFTLPYFFISSPLIHDNHLVIVPIVSLIWWLIYFIKPFLYLLIYIFPAILIPILFMIKKNKNLNIIYIIILVTPLIETIMAKAGTGFRHYTLLFPMCMILLGEIFYYIIKKDKRIGTIALLLFISTNIFFVAPVIPFKTVINNTLEGEEQQAFIEDNFKIRSFIIEYVNEMVKGYDTPQELILNKINEIGYDKDAIFITNEEEFVYLFYTDMINYRDSLDKRPEWIIPRKPYALWGDDKTYQYVLSKINDSYEKITIDSIDYVYLYDEAHPRTHRFVKDTLPVNKYDSYPIEIYHLKS